VGETWPSLGPSTHQYHGLGGLGESWIVCRLPMRKGSAFSGRPTQDFGNGIVKAGFDILAPRMAEASITEALDVC